MRISVRGVVQGVGFRPFVYQLAAKHSLKGWVCNTSGDVKIEVEGERRALDRFLDELVALAPPLARLEDVSVTSHTPQGYSGFEIRHSIAEEGKYQLVSPDIATCQPCLGEVLAPGDRRYRYPFTNCTNCGPRFTIIEDIPYDRPKTTMRSFKMCPQCQSEYDDPMDRRFHAQPNACPRCGPSLKLVDNAGNPVPCDDALAAAARFLKEGKVLAIKGLGGFLLACDATSDKAVKLLRERKRRLFKPLAIMVATVDDAKKHCLVSEKEGELLTSPQCPIVLLRRKEGSRVSPSVAPNLKYLGVMLPYTPLHHVLLRETGLPLVMTSGNLSEEPIAKDNDEALRRLKGIPDYFLMHNRDIYSRYDDSVAIVESHKPQIVRRARGYAPYPIHLPFQSGSDAVLQAMNRHYTRQSYLALTEKLRAARPDISMSADVIVGFPGETNEAYLETLDVIRAVKFDVLYSFKYSERPGTRASKLKDDVPPDEKLERLKGLQALQRAITIENNRDRIGKTYEVLVDGVSSRHANQIHGRTTQNTIVNFDGDISMLGKIVWVKIKRANPNSLTGEMI